jgi:hypothetical protein
MAQRLKTDWILFVTVLAMVSFGVLIVYSASSIMAQMDPRYNSAWHFVKRQAVWGVLATGLMMTLKHTHYRKLQNPAVALTAISLALFLLGMVYWTRHHRWLRRADHWACGYSDSPSRRGDFSGILRHVEGPRHQQPRPAVRRRWRLAGNSGGGVANGHCVGAGRGCGVVFSWPAWVDYYSRGRRCRSVSGFLFIASHTGWAAW